MHAMARGFARSLPVYGRFMVCRLHTVGRCICAMLGGYCFLLFVSFLTRVRVYFAFLERDGSELCQHRSA